MNFVRDINSVHRTALNNKILNGVCMCLFSENEEMGTTSFLATSLHYIMFL